MNTRQRDKYIDKALLVASTAFVLTIIYILSMVLFSGCKKVDDLRKTYGHNGTSTNTQQNNFNLRMTDAPGNYDAVFVEIIGAEVHRDDSGWIPLNVKAGIYNLLDLTNGKDTLIANGQLSPGHISQIRLTLGANNTVVVDSQTYALKTPSGQQSGIKLQVHADILPGITYNMLIDFDANKSIVKTGNGKYILKPVITVVSKGLDGSISGIVLPLAAQPAVYAISGTDTFSTSASIVSGAFFISGLYSGTYKVVVVPKAPYTDTAVLGVGVSLGAVTNVGIITVK